MFISSRKISSYSIVVPREKLKIWQLVIHTSTDGKWYQMEEFIHMSVWGGILAEQILISSNQIDIY